MVQSLDLYQMVTCFIYSYFNNAFNITVNIVNLEIILLQKIKTYINTAKLGRCTCFLRLHCEM